MKSKNNLIVYIVFAASLFFNAHCNKNGSGGNTPNPPQPTVVNEVEVWTTKADQTALLQKSTTAIAFNNNANIYTNIDVDSTIQFQTIDGFGYSLTGGSAMLLNNMDVATRANLLNELFGNSATSIKINVLRISIGASDLDASVFSYNDLPTGQTDIDQTKFSIEVDKVHLIPILKSILAINPDIKIIGSPWSPPVWMKDNGSSIGGSLKPEYYDSYAKYFVKYIQAMKAEGINIFGITPQNEPLHPGNNPSMYMTAEQQRDFIKNSLGPAFATSGITTKIIVYDHNLDRHDYPLTILNDPIAKQFVDGSAFHLYAGGVSAMSEVHNAHPDKNLYFTEQWTGSNGTFDGDLQWHIKNVIIGTTRNWSKIALEWNLANDPSFGPHTPGGCTQCKGALTISGSSVTKNVADYIIAHASKFVPQGSKRISSTESSSLPNVAFLTPTGKKILIVLNEANTAATFNLKYKNKWATIGLPSKAAATIVW